MRSAATIFLVVILFFVLCSCESDQHIFVNSEDSGIEYATVSVCSVDIQLMIENGKGKQVHIKNNNDTSVIVDIDNTSTGAKVLQHCLWADSEDEEPSTGFNTAHTLNLAVYRGEGDFIHWTCSKTISDLFGAYTLCDEVVVSFYKNEEESIEDPEEGSEEDNEIDDSQTDSSDVQDTVVENDDEPDGSDESDESDDSDGVPVYISKCGNGVVETGEDCDKNSIDCSDLGYDSGTADCLADCSGFDESSCYNESGDDDQVQHGCVLNEDCPVTMVCSAEGECLEPYGRPWILTIEEVELSETKNDGTTWDALGGLPDPIVQVIKNGGEVFLSAKHDNTFHADIDESFTISLNKEDTLKFSVYDVDISAHDFVATIFFGEEGNEVVPAGVFRQGRINFTSDGQLKTFIFSFTKNW